MQIVIELSEEDYEVLKQGSTFTKGTQMTRVYEALWDATPLPEHHGRLIDEDELLETAYQVYDEVRHMWTQDFVVNADDISSAPTIIEADKEE